MTLPVIFNIIYVTVLIAGFVAEQLKFLPAGSTNILLGLIAAHASGTMLPAVLTSTKTSTTPDVSTRVSTDIPKVEARPLQKG